MAVFCFESQIDVSADELCAWHHRPGAFERLVPPWETIEVAERDPALVEGARVVLKIRRGPFKFRWEALHQDFEPGRQFRDIQVAGPFSTWIHTHSFKPNGSQAAVLEDRVEYKLPLGGLGSLVAGNYFSESLERTFSQRHAQTKNDLARHSVYADREPLRVVVTGATGMIGTQLCSFLRGGGHRVDRLVRKQPGENSTDIYWNPETGEIDAASLEGADVVIHLAGANIGDKRWSKARKELLMSSRAKGTALLSETLAGLQKKPSALISMSGSGHYGYVDETSKNEDSPAGTDFLARVTVEWEGATQVARDAGIRVVICRAPMILSRRGGGLAKMLPPFLMGGGGVIGTGEQPMSWIALDDLLGFFLFAMFEGELDGPVNVSAPGVVDNREFTKTLGKVIRRPTIIPLPTFVVRTVFGEMGDSLLLGGQRMDCSRLLGAGFEFLYPDLESALRHELGYPID